MVKGAPSRYSTPVLYIPKNTTVAVKKTFVLRVDEEVYKALEKWAADDFRSVNSQLEWLIDAALKKAGRKPGPSKAAKNTSKDDG